MIQRDSQTTGKLQFKILAPSQAEVPASLFRSTIDSKLHANLIFDIQLLRGKVYREYGPIASQLLADGRHHQAVDPQSWHILLQDESGRIMGCSRYRPVQSFQQLGASQSALAQSRKYGPVLKGAVENHIEEARQGNVHYGEAGMWALRPEVRCSTAALNIALMTFVMAEQLGGGLGITTATTRHHSAAILRRLGGRRLAELPAYYEPKYGCVIEVLYFSLSNLHPQYRERLEKLKVDITGVDIVCASIGDRKPVTTPAHVFGNPIHVPAQTGSASFVH